MFKNIFFQYYFDVSLLYIIFYIIWYIFILTLHYVRCILIHCNWRWRSFNSIFNDILLICEFLLRFLISKKSEGKQSLARVNLTATFDITWVAMVQPTGAQNFILFSLFSLASDPSRSLFNSTRKYSNFYESVTRKALRPYFTAAEKFSIIYRASVSHDIILNFKQTRTYLITSDSTFIPNFIPIFFLFFKEKLEILSFIKTG